MFEAFNKQSKLVRVILLLIPFINWVTELVTRWDYYINKKKDTASLIIALIVTFLGLPIGFIDCIAILLTDKMILTD